jgi:2-C-methyl-D-erythritol 4-phosphate cytidylyltransferase
VPKQYLALAGAPILVRTLQALGRAGEVSGIVVPVPRGQVAHTERLLRRFRVRRVLAVVEGGADRQASVRLGLAAAPPGARWVLVHDAVRPFITAGLVGAVLAAARPTGAAACGLPVRETVKRVRGGLVAETLAREGLWLVQTPQAFRRALLEEAHDKALRDGRSGTDDAALVEWLGVPVAMVPGLPGNLKITTWEDLVAARRQAALSAGRARPRR